MFPFLAVPLLVLVCVSQVFGECCSAESTSEFCSVFKLLSLPEQSEVRTFLGENCDGDLAEAVKKMDKRKPNFIRKIILAAPIQFGKKGSDPNFLRFGRSTAEHNFLRFGKSNPGQQNFLRFGRSDPNFLRFGRAANDPNFLRFGKSSDPNFLRFGKRQIDDSEPNFLRFGKRNNFLRFGRASAEQFDREYRKPNFLRFG
uniref:FMRFamide-like neuropeptides 1 n=1 Tax=Steinernema glaseri TaxID=37863 RepID=A0A1I8A9Q5_9BILA